MKSHITAKFRYCFQQLSKQMQKQAREAYKHFQIDPNYPSLRFKKVHPTELIYSCSTATTLFGSGLGPTKNTNG